MQTKRGSLLESIVNIGIGYGIALLSLILLFPLFEIHVPFTTNVWISLWFTSISLARSYAIRRFFNSRVVAQSAKPLTYPAGRNTDVASANRRPLKGPFKGKGWRSNCRRGLGVSSCA